MRKSVTRVWQGWAVCRYRPTRKIGSSHIPTTMSATVQNASKFMNMLIHAMLKFLKGSVMKWSDECSVGIQEIDDQHKNLLKIFSRIEQSLKSADSWSDVHYGLLELRDAAHIHVLLEQALMRLFGFEGLARHISAHQYFFDRLAAMERQSLGTLTKQETITFLSDWFKKHICQADREYADYILSGAKVVRSETWNSSHPMQSTSAKNSSSAVTSDRSLAESVSPT